MGTHSTNAYRPKPLLDLFPAISPYSSGFLAVDDLHQLYWEQSGNPNGVPVLMLHGGPGGGTSPQHRRFFDPEYYRIILFDQRGAGKSSPHGSIVNNTTVDLISDIEKLRAHLSVDRWHLFGGSWGSTLALRYAIAHPKRCISFVLRGVFLMTAGEIEWFLYGIRSIFPEAWDEFTSILSEEEKGDILTSYYKRLTSPDASVQMEAAIDWALYESACSSLIPNYETITTAEQKAKALAISRIEAHYFLNEDMNGKNAIIHSIDRIRSIPCVIVQGRYDVICPIKTAYALHQAWPEADYRVVGDGGHSALDPAIRSQLVEATEHIKHMNLEKKS